MISEKFEARIADLLGHPTTDPHGAPIPAIDGTIPPHASTCLADIVPGTYTRITRVRGDKDTDRLQYLASLGLIPGTDITVCSIAPFDGPMTLQIGTQTVPLDRRLARLIYVTNNDVQ